MTVKEKKYILDNLRPSEILGLYEETLELYEIVSANYVELQEKYNNLCDRISYEEGWDPREEDEQCGE